MSILMDALKQQQPATVVPPSSNMWRNIAIILGVLLALLIGATVGYFLQPKLTASPVIVSEEVSVKAKPEQILLALDSVKVVPETNSLVELAPKEPIAVFTGQDPVVTVTVTDNPAASATVTEELIEAELAVNDNIVETTPVEISAELRDKFASALQATEHASSVPSRRSKEAPAADISELALEIRQTIPRISFEAHVYATSSAQRWVKVNGKTLQENQWLTADIKIKQITAQFVLLDYNNTLFSMAALSSWTPN